MHAGGWHTLPLPGGGGSLPTAAAARPQERRGAAVSSHCWADSGHVAHLRAHPQQYEHLVRSFVEQCLRGGPHPEKCT